MKNQNQIEKIEEMLTRDIKPTQAVLGTQAYGEVGVEFVDSEGVTRRVTVFTDISKRDRDGPHDYSGSPIMFIAKGTEGSWEWDEEVYDAEQITAELVALKTRLEATL